MLEGFWRETELRNTNRLRLSHQTLTNEPLPSPTHSHPVSGEIMQAILLHRGSFESHLVWPQTRDYFALEQDGIFQEHQQLYLNKVREGLLITFHSSLISAHYMWSL